jgi:zinc transporter 5/7
MHRLQELLIVSFLGLLVNIIGITSFGHHGHNHGHSHDHGHSHVGSSNMQGIYLHIIADTLGSAAVVASTLLIQYFGWAGFDPLASCIIAILIFYSSIPLVKSSAISLLMSLPDDVEYNLRNTLAGVSGLRGVAGYSVPKFWLDDSGHNSHDHDHHSHEGHHDHQSHEHDAHHHSHSHSPTKHDDAHHESQTVLGSIHVIVTRGSDLEDVRQRTAHYLKGRGMDVVVQVEKEGEGRCWCGGGRGSRLGQSMS